MGKWLGTAAVTLFAAAAGPTLSGEYLAQPWRSWPSLLLLAWGMTIIALLMWGGVGSGYGIRAVSRYRHAFRLPRAQWRLRYWPLEHIIEPTGVRLVASRDAEVGWRAQIGQEEVSGVVAGHAGDRGLDLHQHPMNPATEPHEGEDVWLLVAVRGRRWWHGRSITEVRRLRLDVTDHRG